MDKVEFLGGILKRVGNFSMNNIQDIIIFQKTVYFIQEFGINMNYNFQWYIFGPYCPNLTYDGFLLKDSINKIEEVKFVDDKLELKFHDLMQFLGKKKNDSIWLEALASVHFQRKHFPKLSKEAIIKIVKEKQDYLNKDNVVEDAWYFLEAFNLMGN
jgi:uncharacterized protein YwgA